MHSRWIVLVRHGAADVGSIRSLAFGFAPGDALPSLLDGGHPCVGPEYLESNRFTLERRNRPADTGIPLVPLEFHEKHIAPFRPGNREGFDPGQIQSISLEHVHGIGQRARLVFDFEH